MENEERFWSLLRAGKVDELQGEASEGVSEGESGHSEFDDDPEVVGVGQRVEEAQHDDDGSDSDSDSDSDSNAVVNSQAVKEALAVNQAIKQQLGEAQNTITGLRGDVDTLKHQLQKMRSYIGTMVIDGGGADQPQAMRGSRIRHVTCGAAHTLAVTENGELYAWGRGTEGQLGTGDTKPLAAPTLIPLKNVRIAFACYNHSFAITEMGGLYAWGDNSSGQLGLGDKIKRTAPELVDALRAVDVVVVAGGKQHSAAVTEEGVLYTWGNGSHNQLGHGDKGEYLQPTRVDHLQFNRVKAVAATDAHTVSLVQGDAQLSLVEPDRNDADKYLVYLRAMLGRLSKKKQAFAQDMINELKQLNRKTNSLERAVSKQAGGAGLAIAADCRFIQDNILEEETSLDFEHLARLQSKVAALEKEREILVAHVMMAKENAGDDGSASELSNSDAGGDAHGNGDAAAGEGGGRGRVVADDSVQSDNESESEWSMKSDDVKEIPDMVKKRNGLKRQYQRARNSPDKQQHEVDRIHTRLMDATARLCEATGLSDVLHGGGAARVVGDASGGASKGVTDIARDVSEHFANLQDNTAARIRTDGVHDRQLSVRAVIHASSRAIDGVLVTVKERYRAQLEEEDSDSPMHLMPRLLVEYGEALKKINDYSEGIMQHTMQRLDTYRANASTPGEEGRSLAASLAPVGNPMAKQRMC